MDITFGDRGVRPSRNRASRAGRRDLAVFWRLWLIASATLAIVIAIYVGLTLLQFRTVQKTLLTERVAVLAKNIVEPFESALALGLPLSSVRNAEALLERARQTDDAIMSIQLVDPDGKVLRRVGDEVSGIDWPTMHAVSTAGSVNLFTGSQYLSFNPIAGPGGTPPGAILVLVDASDNINRSLAVGAKLATAAAAFLVAGGLVIGLALRWAFAREIADFDGVERDIELFERDIWRAELSAPDGASALRRDLNEAHASYLSALARPPALGRSD